MPFILRDHREDLWQRWVKVLDERVAPDYHELIASPLGERILRNLIEDLIALSEAEEYELPALRRRLAERAAAEAGHRLALGFSVVDIVEALQALRLAVLDVLLDALVLDEMPSFGDTLTQLKGLDDFIDRQVAATLSPS